MPVATSVHRGRYIANSAGGTAANSRTKASTGRQRR